MQTRSQHKFQPKNQKFMKFFKPYRKLSKAIFVKVPPNENVWECWENVDMYYHFQKITMFPSLYLFMNGFIFVQFALM